MIPTPHGISRLALVSAALLAPAAAQGRITEDNVRYTVGAISSSQSDSVNCDFTADQSGEPDVLFEQWWYYRVDGDEEERPLRDDGTLTQSYDGRHADLRWADVDRRGLLRADLGLDVISTGSRNGIAHARLTLTNISGRPLRLNVFHYVDLRVCNTNGNSTTGSGFSQTVTGPCPGQTVELGADSADRWCVEEYDTTECGIRDSGRRTLPNRGLPLPNANHTGAVQWRNRDLAPLEEVTFRVRMVHNPGPCGSASSVEYGTGTAGTRGIPELSTSRRPRIGRTARLQVERALPNAAGVLLFGFGRADIQFLNLRILVLAGPRGTRFDFLDLATGGDGSATFSTAVPNNESLCGNLINWQYLFIDPGATGPLPLASTAAVEWVIGS